MTLSRHPRLWIALLLGLVTALSLIVIFAPNAQYQSAASLTEGSVGSADAVGLKIQLQQIGTKDGQATLLVTPTVNGSIGQTLPNGAFFGTRVIYNLDVTEGASLLNIPPGSIAGGTFAQVILKGSEANYPFDNYSTSFFAAASTPSRQGSESTDFFLTDPAVELAGYAITSQQIGFLRGEPSREAIDQDRKAGYGLIAWKIQRSLSTIISALVITLLMLIGSVVSVAITIAILRGARPPSIAVLVWLAAFLFALFQVRGQLPGDPSNGINLDRFIFFPIVLVMVSLVAVNVVLWASREDWDLVNPLSALRNRINDRAGFGDSVQSSEDSAQEASARESEAT